MTSKFASLKKFDPAGRTAWYDLPIGNGARLHCRHAGRSNKPYTSAIVKATSKSGAAKRAAAGQMDASFLDDNLNLDRELFPQYVVIGWENIPTDDNTDVAFGRVACRELLFALPDWIMQDFSTWAGRPMNFLPDDMPTEAEVEEQAGN